MQRPLGGRGLGREKVQSMEKHEAFWVSLKPFIDTGMSSGRATQQKIEPQLKTEAIE